MSDHEASESSRREGDDDSFPAQVLTILKMVRPFTHSDSVKRVRAEQTSIEILEDRAFRISVPMIRVFAS
jgi:hypothetical protein